MGAGAGGAVTPAAAVVASRTSCSVISVLGGVVWRRANRWGALASLLSALATNFVLYYLTGERLDHWDANVFLASLLVGIVALVGVSLLTRPEPADKIESFFGRLQTSSDVADHQSKDHELTRSPTPLLLVNLLRLRQGAAGRGWRAYRDDLSGFAIGWVLVISLVIATVMFL